MAAHQALAAALPAALRLGTMSWAFAGWAGLVYAAGAPEKHLAGHGLTAYTKHPLLRTVEIDRTYYEPIDAAAFRAYAVQTPDDFRFVVKAHEDCTTIQFPPHARYGKRRGESNPRFLDAAYATDAVVAPYIEGLGAKGAALVFQFPPQDVADAASFPERLFDFLRRLPRGPTYAVELRNADLMTPAYGAALADGGAVHCHNAWAAMPSVLDQARRVPPVARRPLLVRWLLRQGDVYGEARERYLPFDRLREPDVIVRDAVATLTAKALAHEVPVLITINNKAEGCAPESAFRLARAILEKLAPV